VVCVTSLAWGTAAKKKKEMGSCRGEQGRYTERGQRSTSPFPRALSLGRIGASQKTGDGKKRTRRGKANTEGNHAQRER